ncbi:hypothetical protein BAU15_01010 [Enterococcus sp. JM4C]|uniref:amino acid permease n=1 Tax=Candidatus Enterococcus huntleyi TaxID=1857217 RepID=UPI00137AEE76|nr:amino acid permease [Enterococcus sp. JM4C]KAF1299256.1 hypothetical protein BAU15_01010 [Enterococcus sp. JM4C]
MSKNLSVSSLILIITTTVYSFSSMATAYFMMGVKALPWFLVSALFYFIPYALIVAQYTKKYAHKSGTLYDWLKDSLSPKVAFITVFLWYCSYFTWMVSLFMKLTIPLSILFFGEDLTKADTWFSLPTNVILAAVAISLVFLIHWLISRGFPAIVTFLKLSSFAMLGLLCLSLVSNLALIMQHADQFWPNIGKSFQAVSFFQGTTNQFASQLPFFIFSITAFGGLDTVASLSDKTSDSQKKYPRALILSAGVIVALYCLGIILWSGANDLTLLRESKHIHLGNLMYQLMENLAANLAQTFHFSAATSALLQQIFVRYTAFTLMAAYLGLLSSISYGPLKSLIKGTPKEIWSPKLLRSNPQKMPIRALYLQAVIVALCILALSVNNHFVGNLFNQLTYMTNISRALPYFIVAISFPFFLKKKIVPQHALFIQNQKVNQLLSLSVCACIFIAISFQLYEPLKLGNYANLASLITGPLLFASFAYALYTRFEYKTRS